SLCPQELGFASPMRRSGWLSIKLGHCRDDVATCLASHCRAGEATATSPHLRHRGRTRAEPQLQALGDVAVASPESKRRGAEVSRARAVIQCRRYWLTERNASGRR